MRHAQRHWLDIQARAAVEKAMGIEPEEIVVGTRDRAFIEAVRDEALADAARALVRAELLHRAAVRAEMVCKRCGTRLKPGLAMLPVVGGTPDFIGDDAVVTVSVVGSRLGKCLKCPDCGWSVTC